MTEMGAGEEAAVAQGTFITFEGIDGCGKSTHAHILARTLEEAGHDVVLTRDPGTAAVAEKIRGILLDRANGTMTAECELLLYEAARAQLVGEVIRPALERGAVVISDRFLDSTTAYQGAGRRLDAGYVRDANALGALGLGPDRTLVLDIGADDSDRRIGRHPDRMESEGRDFRAAVGEAYRELARREPERVRLIDATRPLREVSAAILAALEGLGLDLEPAPEGRGRP